MWIKDPHEENVPFSSEYFRKLNILQLAIFSFTFEVHEKIKKENRLLVLACLWPSAEVNWDGKEKVATLPLHDYSTCSQPFLHHYKVLELTIKMDWIYETPHNSNKSQRTIKVWIQIFLYLVCVQCGFWSVFTYIISFDAHNNSMGQAGITAPHFIEKHIETERLRVSSTLT